MRTTLLVAAVTFAAACGGSKPAPAPTPEPAPAPTPTEAAAPTEPAAPADPASPSDDVLAASALAEQYEVGKGVYMSKGCNTCHEDSGAGNAKNPPVIGENALPKDPPKTTKLRKGVTFTTAADVFGFVKAKMPMPKKGEKLQPLSDDEAYAVVAWMLDANKVALTKKLDASNAASVTLRP